MYEQAKAADDERVLARIISPVTSGKKLGRKLGFPTANQDVGDIKAANGIYVSRVTIDGAVYPAVSNIGTRPTVDGDGVNCESHVIGYSADLYGKSITVELLKFLRPERDFGSVEALRAAIEADVLAAKKYFDIL